MVLMLKVTGLMTQGRADGHEWVTSFLVSHSLDSINWYYIVDQYDNTLVRPSASINRRTSSYSAPVLLLLFFLFFVF